MKFRSLRAVEFQTSSLSARSVFVASHVERPSVAVVDLRKHDTVIVARMVDGYEAVKHVV